MASGATHARNAHRVIWLSIPVSILLSLRIDPQAIAGIGGAVVGWLIEPDLGDLHNVTSRAEKRMWRLHPVIGWAWECFWYPLARAIPHRHPLSHMPPLCTLLRLAYVVFVGWLVMRAVGLHFDAWRWLVTHWPSMRWAYWGFAWWVLQDIVHLAADGWRVKRNRGKR